MVHHRTMVDNINTREGQQAREVRTDLLRTVRKMTNWVCYIACTCCRYLQYMPGSETRRLAIRRTCNQGANTDLPLSVQALAAFPPACQLLRLKLLSALYRCCVIVLGGHWAPAGGIHRQAETLAADTACLLLNVGGTWAEFISTGQPR
jgi:hypothetical protein